MKAYKDFIKKQQGYQCAICLKTFPPSELEIHHIVFKSRGGDERRSNLVALSKQEHRRLHRFPNELTPIVIRYQENLLSFLYND